MESLSILIPTYNTACVELVESLQAQAALLQGCKVEIIVAEDGSTCADIITQNQAIGQTAPACRYIRRRENVGRAAIRNFLARQAQYDWLLFLDSDMTIDNACFLQNYISHAPQGGVVYGGYRIVPPSGKPAHNLRYLFEKHAPQNSDCKLRRLHPYQDFHTSNFLVRRQLMLAYPLDERFRHYGYEDVLWGKRLQQAGIGIEHVDNPTLMRDFEDNAAFLAKTEEGLRTLFQFRDELQGYSRLLALDRLLPGFVAGFIGNMYQWLHRAIKARLTGNKPSLFWFNIYKVMYYWSIRS